MFFTITIFYNAIGLFSFCVLCPHVSGCYLSVALSLVQEDVDSPRIVRRTDSDRKPPPAVSEEDLSVASLLDIPSWAEPIAHTHSESMHGDLLEDLEISQ